MFSTGVYNNQKKGLLTLDRQTHSHTHISLQSLNQAAAWCSGNTLVLINIVALHWAWLLPRWRK